ncbi:MAG: hypothetical protein ACRDLN_12670 [Solirubrobacteraceae bacterium]
MSTVVAVATGMFTLRDQIFPQEGPEAEASVSLYERSVGDVCDALNAAERARSRNERRLSKRLRRLRKSGDQRDALLDSQKEILARSEYVLAQFTGLEVPPVLMSRQRETVAAWERIVARLRGYVERLGTANDRPELVRAVRTLPALYTELAEFRVRRASGLSRLGRENCDLDRPISSPTISLPPTGEPANPGGAEGPEGPANPGGGAPSEPPPGTGTAPPPPPPVRPPANPGPGADG